MFKKSSRTKNIRRKIEVADDEPVTEEVIVQKTTTSLADKKKKIKKTTLSFEEEESEEAFQIKKKTTTGRKLEIRENLISVDPIENTTGATTTYDTETLNKLRQATPSFKKQASTEDALLHEKFPSTANPTIQQLSGIPDASAILVAKKKREQMRKGFSVTDQDDGFIALEDTEEDATGGRLVREEDDVVDDGEAELDKYVDGSFTINQSKAKSMEKERKDGLREMILEAEQDNSDNDDMGRWEEDMIKYGGAKKPTKENNPFAVPDDYRPAQVPEPSKLPTLSDVMSSLSLATNNLNYSIQQHEQNIVEMNMSLKTLEDSYKSIENQVERESERYDYFQELAQFVNDLGEFLDAKFPELEALEEQVNEIFASETELVVSRNFQDSLDDLALFAQVPSLTEEAGQTELDEFGRVKELRNSETARRRRMKERAKRAEHILEDDPEDFKTIKDNGQWTDDEFEKDEKDSERLMTIENTEIKRLLEDVGEEYRTLDSVKTKFEAWKTTFYEDYKMAFGGLSLPGAFEFYIRLELLMWNPFSGETQFDSMDWHKILSKYGVSEEHEDPDTEMLNKIVEKTMIKKTKSLVNMLNFRSSMQMMYASQLLEEVSYYIEPSEKAYKDLAIEFLIALEAQIDKMANVVETISLKTELDQEAEKAKIRFIFSNCKYLKNMTLLRRQLPKEQLKNLSHKIYTKIITPVLKQNGSENEIMEQVESMLRVFSK